MVAKAGSGEKSSIVGYSSLLYYGVFDFMNFSTSSSVLASQSVKPERITFLAPKSSITRIQYNLFFLPPNAIGKSALKSTLKNPYTKTIVPVKYEEFTNQTTPFTFRNFVTISTTESFNKEIYIDNEFFLYRIYKVKRNYFEPVFAFNPESKKKENVNILADSKRFFIKL